MTRNVVGEAVGGAVGELVEGAAVGEEVGEVGDLVAVGEAVGWVVGETVGDRVGEVVGAEVGEAVGAEVGAEVGGEVRLGEVGGGGLADGCVGEAVGISIGGGDIVVVGVAVGASVGGSVGSSQSGLPAGWFTGRVSPQPCSVLTIHGRPPLTRAYNPGRGSGGPPSNPPGRVPQATLRPPTTPTCTSPHPPPSPLAITGPPVLPGHQCSPLPGLAHSTLSPNGLSALWVLL
jgi:hypothetical protein